MRVPVLVLVISLVATGGVLGEVRVGPGSVRVQSTGQPLAEVLSQLSKAASFDLKYEGPAPSVRVFATIEGRSVSETVTRLLEGTGVTWAARLDATGSTIELLVVGGLAQTASTTPGRASAPASRPVAPAPPPEPLEDVSEPPPQPEPPPEPEPAPEPPTQAQPSQPPSTPSTSGGAWLPGGTGGSWSGGSGSSLPRFGSPTGSSAPPGVPLIPAGASMP